MEQPTASARLDELVAHLLARWPEHSAYVAKSLEGRAPDVQSVSEELARLILTLGPQRAGGIDGLVDDYRYLCEALILPEELYFRRNGRYRLSSFADAERECYANAPLMQRYLNGILISNVMWANHAHAFAAYVNRYLPRLPTGGAHLEIGPGHGLFLYFAARRPDLARVEGWDVSPTSIANTRSALTLLGAERPVRLELADMFATAADRESGSFDSIVMSEILEHLEDPVAAMKAASRHLVPGGLMWINLPINSPAPDHIFLVNSPDHAQELVQAADLDVVAIENFPMSGVTLEKAIKLKLTISSVITARKPV